MPEHIALNPMQVEAEILRLSNLLETRTSDYTHAIRRAAEAEARYKFRSATVLLEVIARFAGTRTTVQEREAHVEIATTNEHTAYLIDTATAKSVKEALTALRAQIDAL
ncbi:MAG: hypothetical protein DRQ55_19530, partial [Planctomycetota bacterium]